MANALPHSGDENPNLKYLESIQRKYGKAVASEVGDLLEQMKASGSKPDPFMALQQTLKARRTEKANPFTLLRSVKFTA